MRDALRSEPAVVVAHNHRKMRMMFRLALCSFVAASALRPLSSSGRQLRRFRMATTFLQASSPAVPVITVEKVTLPNGSLMRIESMTPDQPKLDKPVLLFLHGSFHGAWCWTEKFFPFFVLKGYRVAALSWKGTQGNFAGEGVKKVKVQEHVDDLEALLTILPTKIFGLDKQAIKPVIVCHSFGGMALMKALEQDPDMASDLSGIVTMCSVPPSGNGKMTMRFLRSSLLDSWKITAGFAMKRCLTNASLCRELFFGGDKKILENGTIEDYGVSDADVARYQEYFYRDSRATIDLLDLAKKLPSLAAVDGKAPFVDKLPPCLVLGATDDFIVDKEGLEETATYFGLDKPAVVDSPHDVMLGAKWENAAMALDEWLVKNIVS